MLGASRVPPDDLVVVGGLLCSDQVRAASRGPRSCIPQSSVLSRSHKGRVSEQGETKSLYQLLIFAALRRK